MTSKRQLRKVIDDFNLEVEQLQEVNMTLLSSQARLIGELNFEISKQVHLCDVLAKKQVQLDQEIKARMEYEKMVGTLQECRSAFSERITVLENAIGSQQRRMIALVDDLDAAYNSHT